MEYKIKSQFFYSVLFGLVIGGIFSASFSDVFASDTNGTLSGYAWSSQIGWINFGATQGGASITDSALTGYVWNTNIGWINLNPTQGGIENDAEGNLSGYAWSSQVGWINFSGVTVSSVGTFSGTATGTNASINFSCTNCTVSTDWRPASRRGSGPSGGIPAGAGGTQAPPSLITSVIETLREGIQSLIAKISPPTQEGTPIGDLIQYLPIPRISEFVLAPLPFDISFLAEKFPQIEKTFDQVGIENISDIKNLLNNSLKLPTLTEVISGVSGVKGIPLAELSTEERNKIPSQVVFAKDASGFVDFNTVVSINDQGKVEQRIQTTTGDTMELILKPDKPVKKLSGYFALKPKENNGISINTLLRSLVASIVGSMERRLVLSEFEYQYIGDGVYKADVQVPVVGGEYDIITEIEYQDSALDKKEINLIAVVDPEGYIYEKTGVFETRISGAVVSLHWLNPETSEYELWPAKDFQQDNPETTDKRGTYSFLVPNGYYYLKVDAPGYLSYEGNPFEVKEGGGVHINIELKAKYWWLKIIDWKTILLIIVITMLLYNFYKDKRRESYANQYSNNN